MYGVRVARYCRRCTVVLKVRSEHKVYTLLIAVLENGEVIIVVVCITFYR